MSVTMLQSCRAYNVPRGSRLFIRKKKKKVFPDGFNSYRPGGKGGKVFILVS